MKIKRPTNVEEAKALIVLTRFLVCSAQEALGCLMLAPDGVWEDEELRDEYDTIEYAWDKVGLARADFCDE